MRNAWLVLGFTAGGLLLAGFVGHTAVATAQQVGPTPTPGVESLFWGPLDRNRALLGFLIALGLAIVVLVGWLTVPPLLRHIAHKGTVRKARRLLALADPLPVAQVQRVIEELNLRKAALGRRDVELDELVSRLNQRLVQSRIFGRR